MSRLTKLLWFLYLLAVPLSALADPTFWAAVGSFLASHAVAITLAVVAIVESAQARAKARREQERRTAEYNANLADRTAQILDGTPPWRVIVGQATVSGFIAANFTSDKTGTREDGSSYVKPDGYRHLVVVFASHECNAINEIFIAGKAVGPLDSNGYPTGGHFYTKNAPQSRVSHIPPGGVLTVPGGVVQLVNVYTVNHGPDASQDTTTLASVTLQNNNTEIHGPAGTMIHYLASGTVKNVRIYKHLGVPFDTVDAYLNGLKPTQWDASHTVSGHTYIVITLDLEFQEFQGGPPAITADIEGLKVYDPRAQGVPNPYMLGAAAGSPGTVPTGHQWTAPSGVVRTIVGVGEEYGVPYVDVRFAGTPSTSNPVQLFFMTNGAGPAASFDQAMYGSVYAKLKAGSLTNVSSVQLRLSEINGSNAEVTSSSKSLSLPSPAASPTSIRDCLLRHNAVVQSGTTLSAQLSLRFSCTAGAAIDFTLRVGLPCLATNKQVLRYTTNPALHVRNHLLAEYGFQATIAEVNEASVITAANDCDTSTTFEYRDTSGAIVSTFTGPRFTANGAFTTDDSKESVLDDLKSSMAGFVVSSGQWFVSAGVWHPPVLSLTDDPLMGSIELVQAGEPIAEIVNGYRGNYFPAPVYGTGVGYKTNGASIAGNTSIAVDIGSGTIPEKVGVMFDGDDNVYTVKTGISAPGTFTIAYPGLSKALASGVDVTIVAQGGQTPTDFEPYQNATYLAADGKPLWGAASFPYTNDKARCRNLARIKTEAKRAGLVITYPAQMVAWPLQPNDRVSVTSTEYGFTNKTFRVTDWAWSPETAVLLTLQEDSASIYDLADATVIDSNPNTDLPDPTIVSILPSFTAASGTDQLLRLQDGSLQPRILVSWGAISDAYVVGGQGYILISYRGPFDADYRVMRVESDARSVYLSGFKEFDVVSVKGQVVNSLNRKSREVFAGVQVIGESQNPANVAWLTATPIAGGVILAWLPNTEADYAATEIHQEAVWNDATAPVFKGPANTYTLMGLPVGSYTFMAKHVDTTGHKSTTAISVSVIVNTDANSSNLIDSTWWRPGASIIWNQNTDDGGDVNDFVWQVGPKGNIEALWRATAGSNGQAGGGWIQNFGSSPVLDRTKTYRFAVPVKKLSGDGSAYWGVYPSEVCNLNTSMTNGNPYFVYSALPIGKWYLMVGFVFPVGQTGLTNQGAGVYDMTTGVLYASGANWNFANNPANSVPSRALQYYSSAGSQMLFGHPMCHLVDGSEPSMTELLQSSAILNSQQQWGDVNNRPKSLRLVTFGGATSYGHGPGMYDGDTDGYLSGVGRSYTVYVIQRSNNALLSANIYDVYASTANATAMAAQLASLTSAHIVVVISYDEPNANRLFGSLPAQMYRCGASQSCFGSQQFKSRAAYILVGIPGCGEGNGAEFYQGSVDNDTGAWVDVTLFLLNGNIVGLSPSFTPRTLRDYNYTGDYNATSDILLIADPAILLQGNRAEKVANHGAWNAQVASREGFTGGAYASAVVDTDPSTGGGALMFGLNQDPNTNSSYETLDHAIYLDNGTVSMYRSGVGYPTAYTYVRGDTFAVVYDGYNVRYYKNGVVIDTVVHGISAAFYFDSTFWSVGAALKNMRFGPLSEVSGITTPQIVPGAATGVGQTYVASANVGGLFHTPDGFAYQSKLASVTLTPDPTKTGNVVVFVTASLKWSLSAGAYPAAYGALGLHNQTFDGWRNVNVSDGVPPSTTQNGFITLTQYFVQQGNVSTEFALYGKKFDTTNTFTVTDVDLRVEVIRL